MIQRAMKSAGILLAMLLTFSLPALAADKGYATGSFKKAQSQEKKADALPQVLSKSEKPVMGQKILVESNPIDDLLLLMDQDKIPVIMKDGKTTRTHREKTETVDLSRRKTMKRTNFSVWMSIVIPFVLVPLMCLPIGAQVSKEALDSISTPDQVKTSIGTLNFLDGAPYSETAERVYDYLDTMRGVDAFLKGIPGASLQGLIKGARSQGAVECHQVLLFDKLMDSQSLYLTANTSTLYVFPNLDLERDGPTVLEAPAGMLGAFNDAWFRYMQDIGPAGPDKGQGGKYLVLPPGYEGEVPAGYFVLRPRTYDVWVFMRASIAKGLEVAVKNVKDNLRIYPLARKGNPPKMEFISGSGKAFNTIHANDHTFYEHLNEVIQKGPLDMLDPETRGLFASIGMEKGKPFQPDERMKNILSDAVAIANAAARSIVWHPRTDGTMKGIRIYPDTDSAWLMGWVDKNVFFNGKDGKTMNSDARVMFHYPYTAVTPAMAVTIAGLGSDYGLVYVDSKKQPFDGSKTYKLHIPANPPAKDFWALTIYDNQTRSMLQTSQVFPTVGSQAEGLKQNEDGSYDIYFAPKPPEGYENNWLETVPGKGWFMALRLYGPLEPWIEKTWRPGEIELVE